MSNEGNLAEISLRCSDIQNVGEGQHVLSRGQERGPIGGFCGQLAGMYQVGPMAPMC